MQPKRIIKTYQQGWAGDKQRAKSEADLFKNGYTILQEETIKEWNPGTACCLLLLFFPLVFFARVKKTRVVYELQEAINT